jgi:hypothetical protein
LFSKPGGLAWVKKHPEAPIEAMRELGYFSPGA